MLPSPYYTKGHFARHTTPLLVGQCTWYVYGRIQEVGIISPSTLQNKGIFLGNAITWLDDAENDADYETGLQPRQGAIAVWIKTDKDEDEFKGHVAFVENVVDGVAQFSESNATPTSVKPNNVVICRDDQDEGDWKVKLRDSPSTSGNLIGYLPKFSVFPVVGGPTSADGYTWYQIQVNGYDGWAALLNIDTGNAADMAHKSFSWSFTRIKLQPSASSISMRRSPDRYIYLAPIAPTLTVSTSGSTVTVSWTSTATAFRTNRAGATGYTLSYAPYPYTGPDSIGSIDMGTQIGASFDLWEGAAFYVAVQAYNSAGSSGYSNIEYFIID